MTTSPSPRTGVAGGSLQADNDRSHLLALGFGTTVAMWAVGYLCRMPPAWTPNWLLLLLLVACLVVGGYYAGRATSRGWAAGLETGLLASVLNLLILGSLLGGDSANQVVPSALIWLPGSLIAGAALGAAGGILGSRAAPMRGPIDWTAAFSRVAVVATLFLLGIGGLVTSHEAGLAVVDWPNSFGYNMFLYPLSRMTGGVYYEHAHRLFGSLVGLTTLVLTVHLFRKDPRGWVRVYALAAFLLVVFQGILGGLRVTGHFTMSTDPEVTRPSTILAVVHGVTGQIFFALLVALAAFTSRTWKSDHRPTAMAAASADRSLSIVLAVFILLQLFLGAELRHHARGLLVHISMAVVVAAAAVFVSSRAESPRHGQPILHRAGRGLLIMTGVQVLLGIGALIATGGSPSGIAPEAWQAILATLHQVGGALLLGAATLVLAWNHRLLKPGQTKQ